MTRPPGILDRLQAIGSGRGDAVVDEHRRWSHAELLDRVAACARRFAALGIGPGTTVGLTVRDEVRHFLATLALVACGAGQIVLATHDARAVRDAVARRVGVSRHLTDDDVAVDASLVSGTPTIDRSADARLFLKTSGTTGDVNLVAYTLDDLAEQAERHADYAEERLLRLAAIEHNNSKRHRLYAALRGGSNVFAPAARGDVLGWVERCGVTCLDVSRLHVADLVAAGTPLPPSVKLRTGGSAIPLALRRAVRQRVTPRLYVRYAATECGAIAMAGPDDHDGDDESAGRPLPGVHLQVVDDEGRELAAGRSGRIRLRAPGMATAYVDHAEQTAARFRDGWFWPGDVGRLRGDGTLVVEGRADDMIILNGLNIFPAEIERVLERHPQVGEAAAFGVASSVHGQIPMAAVAPRAGGAAPVAGELQAFAREQLGLRAPRRVIVVDALPRNAAGKVSRIALQALAAERRRSSA